MNDYWNNRYAEKEFAYGTSPNEYLKEQLSRITPGRILFICEGEGRNAVHAAAQNWEVEAFDLSEEGRKKAIILAEENSVKINYKIADATLVEYPENTFDVVAIIYAHFPRSIRVSIHEKIANWLKPGGRIILEVFNPNQLNNSSGGPKDLSMLYTPEMMQSDFSSFDILALTTDEIELSEGKYHMGKADVLRFVGRKKDSLV
jgi:2-polyprenyl-3-methyl-5-hydroxy-6-metoxy-1,4-benzoquinol methylase